MEELIPLALLLSAFFLVAPIVTLVKLAEALKRIRLLTARVAALEARAARGPEAQTADEDLPAAPEPAPEQGPETWPVPDDVPETAPAPAAVAGETPEAGPPEPPPPVPPRRPRRSFEETLASQWMVWLGALALALSAVFLFAYAVEQGWLTPLIRVVMGLGLGGALLAAGEWTERNPVAEGRTRDFVPSALSGAGIFAVFVSLFAAYASFGLMGSGAAFVALGLTAYSGLALALRQGWFVALMGLVGGYLVPALVFSGRSTELQVFLYLFVLSAGCLALVMWRRWWWFAALTLVGALGWPWLWIAEGQTWDMSVLGFYLVGIAALFALFSTRLPLSLPEVPLVRWLSAMLRDTSGLGFSLSGVLLLSLANETGWTTPGFVFLGLYGAVAIALALRRSSLESLVVASALIALAGFVLWPQPVHLSTPAGLEAAQFPATGPGYGPFVMPPEFVVFARAALGFALLFGLGGYAGIAVARTPAVWAGVSAAVPVLLFAIAYLRIGALEIDMRWATLATALCLALFAGAAVEARRKGRSDAAVGLLAAGSTAALALGFACVLREAWLTVAIAAEVYAVAWIWARLPVRELRALAATLTGVVIVRLLLNENVLGYGGGIGAFGWVLYGYGLPAAAIWSAAQVFRRQDTDLVVPLCEIAAAGFVLVGVSLQISLWTTGSVLPEGGFFDQSVRSVWWIFAAGVLLHRNVVARRGWTRIAGMLVLGAALIAVFAVQALLRSPLAEPVQLGPWPVLNLLALGYLVPAALFAVLGHFTDFALPRRYRQVLMASAGVLGFLWATLETRHAFWGNVIAMSYERQASDGELYAYSAVWILFALALLAFGIWRGSTAMRYASLGVLMLAVAKVFLVDMSDLTGLLRVFSFLGLGVVLIAIGRVYQKFVFRPRAGAAG